MAGSLMLATEGQSQGIEIWLIKEAGTLVALWMTLAMIARLGGWRMQWTALPSLASEGLGVEVQPQETGPQEDRLKEIATYKPTVDAMRACLTAKQFELFYQPQLNAAGELLALEALLRWNRPGCGLISAGAFINTAEETGFIRELGDWVLREACRQILEWQAKGLAIVPVAINVSPLQLSDPTFAARLLSTINAMHVDPQWIEVEITESAVMADLVSARRQLIALHRAGIRLAMDDFGVGYSSLSRLQDIPLNSIKIDRAFISRIQNVREPILLASIIDLGHQLGLDVTAEGVENEHQLRRLWQLGCDRIQGFHLGRPMPASHAERLLKSLKPRTLSSEQRSETPARTA
jgi:EAL domain-containing protein (putative c-di-GMP-specific phosphodiesterase class I)